MTCLGNIDLKRLQIKLTHTNVRLLCTHLQGYFKLPILISLKHNRLEPL